VRAAFDRVETWTQVTDVSGLLVTFRSTRAFDSEGAVLISDSTLRLRERDEVVGSLLAHGHSVGDVLGASDRFGRELVVIARKTDGSKSPGRPPTATSTADATPAASSCWLGAMTQQQKPTIEPQTGEAPVDLVTTDLVVGDGAEAVPGGTVQVHYVGVDHDTGVEFDASYNRGQPIEFPLRGLIQGWQDGIPGMRVGGRRQLTIPPHLAYGPAGGHQLGGKTLVFVIDLLAVR